MTVIHICINYSVFTISDTVQLFLIVIIVQHFTVISYPFTLSFNSREGVRTVRSTLEMIFTNTYACRTVMTCVLIGYLPVLILLLLLLLLLLIIIIIITITIILMIIRIILKTTMIKNNETSKLTFKNNLKIRAT